MAENYRRGDVAEVDGRRAVYMPTRWEWLDGTWTAIPDTVGPILGNIYDLTSPPTPVPPTPAPAPPPVPSAGSPVAADDEEPRLVAELGIREMPTEDGGCGCCVIVDRVGLQMLRDRLTQLLKTSLVKP